MPLRKLWFSALLAALLPLAGCSGGDVKPNPTAPNYMGQGMENPSDNTDSAFGPGGMLGNLFGGSKGNQEGNGGPGIGVNAFLWRGALDTLAFMPLASADPFGGIIITDWYSPPGTPDERFKATAYSLGRQLRADGVKLSIFRQKLEGGQWVDSQVDPATVGDIENKILERARQLRIQAKSSS